MAAHGEIRRTLMERLELLRSRQGKLEGDLRRLPHPDSEERAQEAENDEVVADLADQDLREIAQLERAIGRIDAGTYGRCESCGGPIPEARLAAMPSATRCVKCAG